MDKTMFSQTLQVQFVNASSAQDGAAALAKALPSLVNLKRLVLSYNNIGPVRLASARVTIVFPRCIRALVIV